MKARERKRFWASAGRRLARWWWVPCSYLAASSAFFWPLPVNLHGALGTDRNDPLLVATLLEWMRAKFPWHFTAWENATYYYPSPHTTYWSELLLGYWPFYLPLRGLTGDPLTSINLLALGLPAVGACGSFVLAWRLTGSRACAWLAGFLASMSMPFAGQAHHFQYTAVAALPWIWLLWLGVAETGRRRWAVALGAALAGLFLTSVYVFLMAELSLAGHAAWLLARRKMPRQLVWRLLLAGGVFAALTGHFAWRYLCVDRTMSHSKYQLLARGHSARLSDFLGVAGPRHLWAWGITRRGQSERVLFPGFACAGLAVYAAASAFRAGRKPFPVPADRSQLTWLGMWAAGAVAVAVGPWPGGHEALRFAAPFYWLSQIVPGFSIVRAPGRFMLLAMLPLGLLAGWGLKRLWDRGVSRWAIAGLAVLALAEEMPGGISVAPADHRLPQAIPRVYGILKERDRQRPVVILNYPSSNDQWRAEYMYCWSQHQLPMIGGYSGLPDDLSVRIFAQMARQAPAKWPGVVAQSPATHLVIHIPSGSGPPVSWRDVWAAFGPRVERFPETADGLWSETWLVTLDRYAQVAPRGQAHP